MSSFLAAAVSASSLGSTGSDLGLAVGRLSVMIVVGVGSTLTPDCCDHQFVMCEYGDGVGNAILAPDLLVEVCLWSEKIRTELEKLPSQ